MLAKINGIIENFNDCGRHFAPRATNYKCKSKFAIYICVCVCE